MPLDGYLLQHPILSRDEERDLAERMHAGDREARDTLILHNLRLVASIAKRYVPEDPCITMDDLVMAGVVALVRACDTYRLDAGAAFSTYAYQKIRGAVQVESFRHGQVSMSWEDRRTHKIPRILEMDRVSTRKLHERPGAHELIADIDTINDFENVDTAADAERAVSELMKRVNLIDTHRAALDNWMAGAGSREACRQQGLADNMMGYIFRKLRRAYEDLYARPD